ncbi:hypothetical protein NNO85_18625, partial [Acinetobacter baumannii]|uniref:hypothetical protein n=1 Tax=Acinetobacter baumannii TaxID=470 RepID=UPI0020CF7EBE
EMFHQALLLLLTMAVSAEAAQLAAEDRTKPIEVYVVGGGDAAKLIERTGFDLIQREFLSQRTLTLLGQRGEQLVLFVVDPKLETGSTPPERLFIKEFPTCDAQGLRTCCEPQSQATFLKAPQGWIAAGTVCLEYEE